MTDREQFFSERPDWGALYADRLVQLLTDVTGQRGINDFDVYNFYAHHPQRRRYPRRLKS